MIKPSAHPLLALGLILALGGCVSLLPSASPATLYRFGVAGQPATTPSGEGLGSVAVLDDGVGFDHVAATDQILTVNGDQVAYIKDARWAAPAPQLFHEAVQQAFEEAGGPARLVERMGASKATLILRMEVRRFEAHYTGGADSAPTIEVRVRVALNKPAGAGLVGVRMFEADVPASENRVSAIADAFSQATTKVLTDVTAWVNQASAA